MEDLKYPIGRFKAPEKITPSSIRQWINDIESLPEKLSSALEEVSEEFLDTPYRPGGWSVRQLIHHIADSHLNSYIRFKWALTEQSPTIKAYDEKAWAELEDAKTTPIEVSLALLNALHQRWGLVLKNLGETDLDKYFIHPETGGKIPLKLNIALYAWHGNHHLAHILALKKRINGSNG